MRRRTASAGRAVRIAAWIAAAIACAAPHCAAQPDEYPSPEKDWFTIETKHFLVHFHDGTERTARATAVIAEEIYGPITSLYGHEPDSKVSIVIKDVSDYSNGAAFFFNNRIDIWTSPLDFDLRGTHNWLRNVIAHEFTHVIQIQSSLKWGRGIPALTFQWFGYEKERRRDVLYGYPNTLVSYPFPGVIVPPWMAEGTAQYMRPQFGYENWDAHRDMVLRSYVLSDSMLTWSEMQAFGKTSLGNESVYNAGYNLTRYIARTYGEDAIVAITRTMGKPFVFTVGAAIRSVIGKGGSALYDEWKAHLREEYDRRIAPVLRTRVEGNLVADVGFANFYPTPSADGATLWYVSNKTADFFGQSALYARDLASQHEEALAYGVHSTISPTPDGASLVYSKYDPPTVHGHLFYDLYRYDFGTRDEVRLTSGLRARNPAVSPDGSRIAFVYEADGNVNIGMVDRDGTHFRAVTSFAHGEQAFAPQWAPDGSQLVFGYAPRAQREIARVAPDGSDFRILVSDSVADCRDPRYSADGETLYYSSDPSGIFNIFRRPATGGPAEQLTNVVGGAFMPAVGRDGTLYYAAYTAGGYKIAALPAPRPLDTAGASYLPAGAYVPPSASAADADRDWNALRQFHPATTSDAAERPYRNVFQSMMFFPTLRVDEYNAENTGLSLFKPGLTFYSSDMLGRFSLLGSAAINVKFERDLSIAVTYQDRIPLLSALGFYPSLTLEGFNVTRKTHSAIALPLDTVRVEVGFNLLEFALRIRHPVFDHRTQLEIGYRHSRYTSTVGSFRNPDTDGLVPANDNLYLIGNDISVDLHREEIEPSRDAEINPAGYRLHLRWDYESNRFNPTGEYDFDVSSGLLVPKYRDIAFHRFEGTFFVGERLPGWNHTLSLRLHAGTIAGPPVDEFFDFYAGGIVGMQGYTYYALGGNETYAATLTYRFPIAPSMDLHVGHLLFDKLYASVFTDIGDATARPEELTLRGAKRDVGFELRLQAFSFSMYPTSVFASGAYGLTSFTRRFELQQVTYGHEWRWYVGVLFGFDLSDGAARGPVPR